MTNVDEAAHYDLATRYDLAIVGSGSAAFAAAIEARRKDASVVMIEHGALGGTCVNVGCIPSKALLAAADARHVALDQHFPGIATTAAGVDMAALVDGKNAIVGALRHEKYEELAGLYGFDILHGHARFVAGPMLEVNGERIGAECYVIATGSSPWAPPIPGLDETGYLTSTTAMELDHVPSSLVVIGGGPVGLEQGQLFSRLGSAVTLVVRGRVAPAEEPEISETLAGIFAGEGIDVHSGTTVAKVIRGNGHVEVSLEGAPGLPELRAEALLVATGRRPNTAGLGLNAVGVTVGARGEVVVDDELRSTNPRIFAAGDVTGHPQFVYVAGKHGAVVAGNTMDGAHQRAGYRSLPRVTFTSPAIASVGMTEAEADAQGFACECRVLPLAQVPRAIVNRDTRGVAKIVAERASGRVLGVHLLAEGAGDAILAAVYALEAGFTVEHLATAWTPYLTMAEAIKLTAQSFTREMAALSCCAW
ncbi:MAG: mercury(II) reductase [Acidimicrobiales bacterium]